MTYNTLMASKKYNRFNFHRHTFCVFNEVNASELDNKKVDYKSKSGSCYYFSELGVYRQSNHWGRAANCKWRLESSNHETTSRSKVGFALWTAFHEDNDFEKLYFIAVDFEKRSVIYLHKDSDSRSEGRLLRTVKDTTSIIKQIRSLFENDSWAKYFDDISIDILRKRIITALIDSNKTLQQIKSEMRNSA